MNNRQRHQSHNHQSNQFHQRQPHGQNASAGTGNSSERRRDFLWRERVRLELEMQHWLAYGSTLFEQWQQVQARKAALGNQVPKLAGQILLSSLAGIRQLPAERLYSYEKERIAQEESRIQQETIRCNGEVTGIEAQIRVIDFELSLL
jgi:hypothetical protein